MRLCHPKQSRYKATMRDVIDRYIENTLPAKTDKPKTIAQQIQQLHWWRSCIGNTEIARLDKFLLVEARDMLVSKGYKSATINAYLAVMNHLLNVARDEWNMIEHNPMQGVKRMTVKNDRTRYLKDEELRALMQSCALETRKPLLEIVLLALSTGARKNELLGIRLMDIDIARRCIYIHNTKNGKSRQLALSGEALKCVLHHVDKARTGQTYLFEARREAKPIRIDVEFRRCRDRAGVKDFVFHDLRHSFASYMAMSGRSIGEVKTALGHSDIKTTMRYVHFCDEHIADGVTHMVEQRITPNLSGDMHAQT